MFLLPYLYKSWPVGISTLDLLLSTDDDDQLKLFERLAKPVLFFFPTWITRANAGLFDAAASICIAFNSATTSKESCTYRIEQQQQQQLETMMGIQETDLSRLFRDFNGMLHLMKNLWLVSF